MSAGLSKIIQLTGAASAMGAGFSKIIQLTVAVSAMGAGSARSRGQCGNLSYCCVRCCVGS
jgi:hypothetical protein